MVNFPSVSLASEAPTSRQRWLRSRLRHLSLARAVGRAVGIFFHFKYRDPHAAVLWCEADRVWMGRETFLYWALSDAQIDIPWVVASAVGAPQDPEELCSAVETELEKYWAQRVAALPRRKKPHWHALP